MHSDDADKEDYDKVTEAFDSDFPPVENVFHERTLFARMRQNPGETVASFSARLHEAANAREWTQCGLMKLEGFARNGSVVLVSEKSLHYAYLCHTGGLV